MKNIIHRREQGVKNCSSSIDENAGKSLPEFLRLPKTGSRCSVTGLSRSHLNSLILPTEENGYQPPVRSVSLRKRGAVRGVRLIPTNELLDYLRNKLKNQNGGGN